MNKINKNHSEPKSSNDNYTDGFPVGDNTSKKDEIKSRDPSRPFNSGRDSDKKSDKDYNSTGTTMNDKDKYKK